MDLHDLPLIISVKCVPRRDTGELTNEIKGYEKHEPGQAAPSAASATAATPPREKKVLPWKRDK